MSHFYLQGFHDVDIVKSLQEIAEKNTVFHKADFLIDKQILKKQQKLHNLMTKIIYGFQKKKAHIVLMREILLLQTLPNTTNLCFIKIKMYLLIL